MQKPRNFNIKIIQSILGVLTVASFLFFVVGEIVLPAENRLGTAVYETYEGTWEQVKEDGVRTPVQLPGQMESVQGEWVTLETVLPTDMDNTWFCFRSLQQDFKMYVDGELRQEYSTVDTQLFGKTSTIAFVWVKMTEEDAGKVMRIEFMSDSFYSGYMEEILQGEKSDIKTYLFGQYALSALMAAFMFLVGLTVVIACQPLNPFFKGNTEMFSLGVAILMATTWLLVESRLRQFFLPNSTIAMYMGFFMMMLLAYPFLSYLNRVQKRRYERIYKYVMLWTIVNFVVCTGLQILDIKDFFETMTSSHVLLGGTIVVSLVTIALDIKSKAVLEYRPVAIGFAGILLAGVIEIFLAYSVNSKLNGVPLCTALIWLLCAAGIKVGKEMTQAETEKQTAIAASKAQAQFLANMSHEIRTPINTILGMNEMILRENADKTISGYAKHIKRAGHMLLGLINDILDFSKMEAGKLEIVAAEYSLATLLQDVQLGMRKRAEEKGLDFKVEIEQNLPAVLLGDELRMKQILNNILSNAVKYTKKGGITFSVKGTYENVHNKFALCISVEDTGIGIHEDDLNHLFDSFRRLELEKNRHIQGTGLGLCITKQLVDNMNGTIEVSSRYGEGTRFEITIPQEIVSMKEAGVHEAPCESEDTGFFRAPDARILGVDDDRVNLAVLKALLKRSEVKLDLAMSGKQALEFTQQKKYDLILMDHMMPEMDGIETLHALRKEEDNINRDTKVIVLTANAIRGAEQEYRKAGFDDYLSKPIDPELAERMLRKYLEK